MWDEPGYALAVMSLLALVESGNPFTFLFVYNYHILSLDDNTRLICLQFRTFVTAVVDGLLYIQLSM